MNHKTHSGFCTRDYRSNRDILMIIQQISNQKTLSVSLLPINTITGPDASFALKDIFFISNFFNSKFIAIICLFNILYINYAQIQLKLIISFIYNYKCLKFTIKKNDNSALLRNLTWIKLSIFKNYIPLYGRFFNLQETNYQNINLNQPYHITNLEKTDQKNTYNCQVKSDNNEESAKAFFKFSPLIDPIKFMVGKYGDLTGRHKKIITKIIWK